MKRYPYYLRMSLLACILPSVAMEIRRAPWHNLILSIAAGLLLWGIVLMYLRRTGRSDWNGPKWGKKLRTSPRFSRVLAIVPVLCAAWVPLLILLNRRWGLSDGQLGMACGVPLGISLAVLVIIKSKHTSCCDPLEPVAAKQSGTN